MHKCLDAIKDKTLSEKILSLAGIDKNQNELSPDEIQKVMAAADKIVSDHAAALNKIYTDKGVGIEIKPKISPEWKKLSLQEKLKLAKENLPNVSSLSDLDVVKMADKNAKMLLAKLQQQKPDENTKKPDSQVEPKPAEKSDLVEKTNQPVKEIDPSVKKIADKFGVSNEVAAEIKDVIDNTKNREEGISKIKEIINKNTTLDTSDQSNDGENTPLNLEGIDPEFYESIKNKTADFQSPEQRVLLEQSGKATANDARKQLEDAGGVVWQNFPNTPERMGIGESGGATGPDVGDGGPGTGQNLPLHNFGFGGYKGSIEKNTAQKSLQEILSGEGYTDKQRAMAASYIAALRLLNNEPPNFIGRIFKRAANTSGRRIVIQYNDQLDSRLMFSDKGFIAINAAGILKRIKEFGGENRFMTWLESALQEEVIHLAMTRVADEKEILEVAESMSEDEKIAVAKLYGKHKDGKILMNDYQLASEYIRQILQEKIFGTATELLKPRETTLQKVRHIARQLLAYIRQTFAGTKNEKAKEIVSRLENFVKDKPRIVVGGPSGAETQTPQKAPEKKTEATVQQLSADAIARLNDLTEQVKQGNNAKDAINKIEEEYGGFVEYALERNKYSSVAQLWKLYQFNPDAIIRMLDEYKKTVAEKKANEEKQNEERKKIREQAKEEMIKKTQKDSPFNVERELSELNDKVYEAQANISRAKDADEAIAEYNRVKKERDDFKKSIEDKKAALKDKQQLEYLIDDVKEKHEKYGDQYEFKKQFDYDPRLAALEEEKDMVQFIESGELKKASEKAGATDSDEFYKRQAESHKDNIRILEKDLADNPPKIKSEKTDASQNDKDILKSLIKQEKEISNQKGYEFKELYDKDPRLAALAGAKKTLEFWSSPAYEKSLYDNEKKALPKQIESLKNDISILENDLKNSPPKATKQAKKIEEINKEIKRIGEDRDAVLSRIEDHEEEILNAKSDRDEKIDKINAEIKKIRESKKSGQQKEDKIDELKQEIEDAKDDYESTVQSYKDDIKSEKADIKRYEKDLQKLNKELQKYLSTELDTSSGENLDDDINDLWDEIKKEKPRVRVRLRNTWQDEVDDQTEEKAAEEEKYIFGQTSAGEDKIESFKMSEGFDKMFGTDETVANNLGTEWSDKDSKYKAQKEMLEDSQEMIGLAQTMFGGSDIMIYGPRLLDYIINRMSNDLGVANKKIVLLGSLLGEMINHIHRFKSDADKLRPLYNKAYDYYKSLMNYSGRNLVAGKVILLFRDKYMSDIYHDVILEKFEFDRLNMMKEYEMSDINDEDAESFDNSKVITKDEYDRQVAEDAKDRKDSNEKSGKRRRRSADVYKQDSKAAEEEVEKKYGSKDNLAKTIIDAIRNLNCK